MRAMTSRRPVRHSRPATLLAVLALLAPAPALAQVQTDRFEPIRAKIREAIAEGEVPSVAVAVAQHGRIVWEEGFGLANRERNLPATAQTPYSLASISKPFTATALMQLVEEGKIDLDHPANDYLGAAKITGLAGDASGATVRRVMNHTAGLPLHYQFFYAGDPYQRVNMDTAIARYAILVNPPGQLWEYSNLGYGILDYIIERTSGTSYEAFMQQRVFEPLGLTQTFIGTGAGHDEAAVRYDTAGKPVPFYDFDHRGGSAVWASAHDLVRFGMFHLKDHLKGQQRILKDATLDEMHRLQSPPGSELGYGLGWIVTPGYNGYLRVSHTGGMPGVATALTLYPEADLAIVVLLNATKPLSAIVTDDIAEVVLGQKFAEGRKAERARREAEAKAAPTSPAAGLLGEWRGTVRTYSGTVPLSLTVKPDGDVHVKLGAAMPTLVSETTFGKADLTGLFPGQLPTADAERHPAVELQLHLRGATLAGEATAMSRTLGAITSYVELTRKAP
ncbi:MAG TPA: serine hydrolase domain-containing protein [Longimicrobiales bacterium]|nr:serine hydrolase domain-containing protein [Longimicrobiales bacterium]